MNVQLVRVSDDYPLWSGHFQRELKDIFTVQDEISRSIVNELRLKLGRGQRRYNTNLEAYDLYLKARTLTNVYPAANRERFLASLPLFEATIAKDANSLHLHMQVLPMSTHICRRHRVAFLQNWPMPG